MADHSTIFVLPLLVLVLVSGMVEEEMKNGQSLWKKTSSIIKASTGNLTKEQISSLNQMISKLNENIQIFRGELTMEEFKSVTAVEQMAEIVKEDIIMYNSFVVHMFNLTEKEVGMTRNDFCQAVAKICAKTWVFPSEFKTKPANETEIIEIIHKDYKDIIDGAINPPKTRRSNE